MWHLTHDIPEDDFNVEKGGQVEIIGWLYQYYNTEPKAQVFARPSGQKIKKKEIPAATQLFTPDWIVRYMVENSLGRLWLEGHPDGELRDQWKYYLDEAEQEPDVAAQLEELRAERRTLNPEDIKVIDPCMGSGHILVYAFDVLMQIYDKAGWERREAAQSIIVNNLYGLDIDKRAWQMAYFAVMMKARQYDRRFLTRGIQPKVYYPGGDKELEEFGSLALVDEPGEMPEGPQTMFDLVDYENRLNAWSYRYLLAQKYDVVVTNPPYMAVSNASGKMQEYVKKNFPDSKADLFAVFMERCGQLAGKNGYQAMITQHAWMFLSSFEKLRAKLQAVNTVNMAHLGARAFEEIGGEVVQTTSFVMRKNHIKGYKGTYCRLTEPNTQQGKEDMFLAGGNRYIAQQDNFLKIPGAPVAYWVSEKQTILFDNPCVGDIALSDGQNITGNNERFLRYLWEVDGTQIGANRRWVPCARGGNFRRWDGNIDEVIDWSDTATQHYKADNISRIVPEYIRFRKGITWSRIASANIGFRQLHPEHLFEKTGVSIFVKQNEQYDYLLALLNSKVTKYLMQLITQVITLQVRDVFAIPYVYTKAYSNVISLKTQECINLSCSDWDSFETSWDFKEHPLYTSARWASRNGEWITVRQAFEDWQGVAERRFQQLKANEEELNRIFIDIYGLQDELTPEVEDKDVTVRRADLGRDIRSLLSYAVGCMFGRYSLDVPGLAYAGGDFGSVYRKDRLVDEKGNPITFGGISISVSKDYTYISRDGTWIEATFPVNGDNIIPLTDEAYLEDDIVSRLCQWLRVVYGENTLEENLDFIAKALGNKGSTSREVIRNYFLKDFFADHCKIYQKRPIYWLFDSGKQNGFKALVYLHRYTPDTIGKLRVDYLHRLQRVYASEIERMQDMIDNSQNPREVTTSTKRKEKLQKQLKECREYDEKIAHLALARIELDLDDGVKVNYEKVQTAADGRKYPVLGKI